MIVRKIAIGGMLAQMALAAFVFAGDMTLVKMTWDPAKKPVPVDPVLLQTWASYHKIAVGAFTDMRPGNKEIIGKESNDDNYYYTKSSVSGWLQSSITKALSLYHLDVDSVTPVLKIYGEIRNFHVNEDNLYEGTIETALAITDENGAVYWKGVIKGNGRIWGRDQSATNVVQSLSNACLDWVVTMLENSEIIKAFAMSSPVQGQAAEDFSNIHTTPILYEQESSIREEEIGSPVFSKPIFLTVLAPSMVFAGGILFAADNPQQRQHAFNSVALPIGGVVIGIISIKKWIQYKQSLSGMR